MLSLHACSCAFPFFCPTWYFYRIFGNFTSCTLISLIFQFFRVFLGLWPPLKRKRKKKTTTTTKLTIKATTTKVPMTNNKKVQFLLSMYLPEYVQTLSGWSLKQNWVVPLLHFCQKPSIMGVYTSASALHTLRVLFYGFLLRLLFLWRHGGWCRRSGCHRGFPCPSFLTMVGNHWHHLLPIPRTTRYSLQGSTSPRGLEVRSFRTKGTDSGSSSGMA